MKTAERIDALLAMRGRLEPWVGGFDREMLVEWLRSELGDEGVLDDWVVHGDIHTKAVAHSPLLHIVSGNTPHAAFQSVFRGLLLGCRNRVKLPSAGLPDFEEWLAELPGGFASLVQTRRDLPPEWLDSKAAVVFGNAETIATFRKLLPPGTPIIEHGPKLSIAVIFDPTPEAAARVAEDILRHDQRGCLSVQAVFVDAPEPEIHRFGDALSAAMQRFREQHGRALPVLSESGAVANARELVRFREANGDGLKLWESRGSTAWTVVFDPNPRLHPGPLNGFVSLHPLPARLTAATLGPETAFISTAAIHPFTLEWAGRLDDLSPPRICEVGKAQEPTIFWHHDGGLPLAGLVRWRDLG